MVSTIAEANSLFPATFHKRLQVNWCNNPHLSLSTVHKSDAENYQFQSTLEKKKQAT